MTAWQWVELVFAIIGIGSTLCCAMLAVLVFCKIRSRRREANW